MIFISYNCATHRDALCFILHMCILIKYSYVIHFSLILFDVAPLLSLHHPTTLGTDYPCTLPPTESTLPVASINGYVKLANNDYNSVMNAIATVGPLAINVDASTWHAYEGGVFNGCNQKNPDVNHVVVMVGYGEVGFFFFFGHFFIFYGNT